MDEEKSSYAFALGTTSEQKERKEKGNERADQQQLGFWPEQGDLFRSTRRKGGDDD
ncbi:MAG: hypothetical protein ABEJ02_03535 [Candidatus Paceibacteria bacterium]